MDHVRYVDEEQAAAVPPTERVVQRLLAHGSGVPGCSVSWIRTPVGGGSPEGLHVHAVDQVFYVLAGSMGIEVGGSEQVVHPGGIVVFPAGAPHRNWNAGSEPTVHLAINAPAPDPAVPFAVPAG
jgi:mannose-6-phosphate isomerase-like protein (cupin superfamily)